MIKLENKSTIRCSTSQNSLKKICAVRKKIVEAILPAKAWNRLERLKPFLTAPIFIKLIEHKESAVCTAKELAHARWFLNKDDNLIVGTAQFCQGSLR